MSLLFKLVFFLLGTNFLLADQVNASTSIAEHQEIQSQSQASQDRFTYLLLYEILDKQDIGYSVEFPLFFSPVR